MNSIRYAEHGGRKTIRPRDIAVGVAVTLRAYNNVFLRGGVESTISTLNNTFTDDSDEPSDDSDSEVSDEPVFYYHVERCATCGEEEEPLNASDQCKSCFTGDARLVQAVSSSSSSSPPAP